MGMKKFRTGEESLLSRIRKKLVENTEWYKKKKEGEEEEGEKEDGESLENNEAKAWKHWRKGGRRKRESRKEGIMHTTSDTIQGVMFIAHTEKSELAKRVREKLLKFEEISRIRIKLVERIGSKIVDLVHKSDP